MPARWIELSNPIRVREDYFIVYQALFQLRLQPRQPLPGILDFGPAGVDVFPEIEKARVTFYDFGWAITNQFFFAGP
jgi:hypothetical protein